MAWFRADYGSEGSSIPLVSWSTGTDAEIIAMIEGYYNGDIPLSVIESVWSIGDKRSISLSTMETTDTITDSHHADNYEFVIIDFNHDLLTNPINGITKALITVQQDRILYKNTTDKTYTSSNPSVSDEGGYIQNTANSATCWNTCHRRTWCNEIYYNAFPQYIKNNIKEVYKSTQHSGSSYIWTANTDKCFLLSEMEVLGRKSSSNETGENTAHYINGTSGSTIMMPIGGIQYGYYVLPDNIYKKPIYLTNNSKSSYWWLRSFSTGYYFVCVTFSGVVSSAYITYPRGIAPAFCL